MEPSSYIVDDKVKSSQTNGGKANEGNILAIPFLSTDTKVPKKYTNICRSLFIPEVITKTKKVKIHQIVH